MLADNVGAAVERRVRSSPRAVVAAEVTDSALAEQLLGYVNAGLLTFAEQAIHLSGSAEHTLYRECLLRHVHRPDGPSLFPNIVAAERQQLIRAVDHFVVMAVIERLINRPHARLGCNISAMSAAVDADWSDVFAHLDANPGVAQRLVVEITETAPLAQGHAPFFNALRTRGVKIALDDYGAGHSTAERLAIVRPDIVKVDSGYTRNARACLSEVTSLRRLADELRASGAVVVLEGVESEVDRATAFFAGIAWLQGYGAVAMNSAASDQR